MTALVQRWLIGRARYRPASETIVTSRHEVAELASDREPKAFVARHHYLGTYPAARRRFGLFERGDLVGVAVFSHPCSDRVLTRTFPGVPAADSIELGRFVLLDRVPGNGETWFLGRCFELLRRSGLHGVLSFSDPVPRAGRDGELVMPGHVGTIYQAHNGVYLGRASARTLKVFADDGGVMSDRAVGKLQRRERGWRYAAEQLCRRGADRPGDDLRAWANHWLDPATGLVRAVRHPGNHRYAWVLDRKQRHRLPASLPYPKQPDLQRA